MPYNDSDFRIALSSVDKKNAGIWVWCADQARGSVGLEPMAQPEAGSVAAQMFQV